MRGIEDIWLREKIGWNKEDGDVVRDMIYKYYICMYFMFMYLLSIKIEMKGKIHKNKFIEYICIYPNLNYT